MNKLFKFITIKLLKYINKITKIGYYSLSFVLKIFKSCKYIPLYKVTIS